MTRPPASELTRNSLKRFMEIVVRALRAQLSKAAEICGRVLLPTGEGGPKSRMRGTRFANIATLTRPSATLSRWERERSQTDLTSLDRGHFPGHPVICQFAVLRVLGIRLDSSWRCLQGDL